MIEDMMKALKDFLIDFVNFVIQFVVNCVDSVMSPIVDSLPQLNWDASYVLGFWGFANTWVALNYGITLIVAYFAWMAGVALIKWILGLIPTIN